jgi:hypothetical protein
LTTVAIDQLRPARSLATRSQAMSASCSRLGPSPRRLAPDQHSSPQSTRGSHSQLCRSCIVNTGGGLESRQAKPSQGVPAPGTSCQPHLARGALPQHQPMLWFRPGGAPSARPAGEAVAALPRASSRPCKPAGTFASMQDAMRGHDATIRTREPKGQNST